MRFHRLLPLAVVASTAFAFSATSDYRREEFSSSLTGYDGHVGAGALAITRTMKGDADPVETLRFRATSTENLNGLHLILETPSETETDFGPVQVRVIPGRRDAPDTYVATLEFRSGGEGFPPGTPSLDSFAGGVAELMEPGSSDLTRVDAPRSSIDTGEVYLRGGIAEIPLVGGPIVDGATVKRQVRAPLRGTEALPGARGWMESVYVNAPGGVSQEIRVRGLRLGAGRAYEAMVDLGEGTAWLGRLRAGRSRQAVVILRTQDEVRGAMDPAFHVEGIGGFVLRSVDAGVGSPRESLSFVAHYLAGDLDYRIYLRRAGGEEWVDFGPCTNSLPLPADGGGVVYNTSFREEYDGEDYPGSVSTLREFAGGEIALVAMESAPTLSIQEAPPSVPTFLMTGHVPEFPYFPAEGVLGLSGRPVEVRDQGGEVVLQGTFPVIEDETDR